MGPHLCHVSGTVTSCELAAEGPTGQQQQGRVCTWLLELPSMLRSASPTGSIRPLSATSFP